ncbi:MAG: hypothetical protein KKF16_03595 [Euryarchaeota archaeon]|nr:hypothetical protein [Euryarchaeota archaeon]MBV1728916.1 hypothetical protein [Methanobacterium sp.]MBU4548055.1 hypothetical protein [Euryarchaeota archaeon]MBU4608236.1 hypothetical protein [Euryarchaeota archaeon]MBV1755247.1 hypothetical protein [Methanobacterium sp.]
MVLELLGYFEIKTIAIIIEIANIGILSALLYLYFKSYHQIKIGFTVGLILFAVMLLIKSISTIVFLMVDPELLVGRPVYIGGVIQFIALLILLKITWDY